MSIKRLDKTFESLRQIMKEKLHIKHTFHLKMKMAKQLLNAAQMALLLWASEHGSTLAEITFYGYNLSIIAEIAMLRMLFKFP